MAGDVYFGHSDPPFSEHADPLSFVGMRGKPAMRLCDLKTTKMLALNREDLNQVIGYYFLSLIGGVNGEDLPEIEEVGFYFARYGFVWKMRLLGLHTRTQWVVLAGEFVRLVDSSRLVF